MLCAMLVYCNVSHATDVFTAVLRIYVMTIASAPVAKGRSYLLEYLVLCVGVIWAVEHHLYWDWKRANVVCKQRTGERDDKDC